MKAIAEHFDKKATSYNQERAQSWLGRLVAQEKKIVVALVDPQPKEEILDAGCGAGDYSVILKERGARVYGVDIAPVMIQELKKKNIPGSVEDIETMKLKKKFDKIVSVGALEFCPYPEKVMQNLKEHLKTRGRMILLFPTKSLFGILYYFYHRTHGIKIKLFSLKKMKRAMESMQLKIVATKRADSSHCFYVIKAEKTV